MQKIRFTFLGTLVLISALVIYKIPINLGLDLQGGMQILLEAFLIPLNLQFPKTETKETQLRPHSMQVP